MKKMLFLLLAAMLVISGSAVAFAQSWYDPGWGSQRAVKVSNPGSSTLTDFQVQITLDSSFDFSGAKSDGSDLRVTSADGVTPVPFWIESWTPASGKASIWLKLSSLPSGGTTVYLYYGNPNASFTPQEGPPTGPFTKAAGNPIVPVGDPGLGKSRLAENIVYDSVSAHYWMVCTDETGPGLIWSDTPADPASWHWFGNVYTSAGGSYGPHLMQDNGTWYLFFSDWSGNNADPHSIVAMTATSITGPYTTPVVVLSPNPGTWENWRVDEPFVFKRNDGKFVMMYMGDQTGNVGLSTERIGYATADNPLGPYTKYAGNPVLDFGPAGSYDAGTIADPWVYLFNGTYYIGYASSPTQTSPWQTAYATTTDFVTFTKQGLLLPVSSSGWDSVNSFRGAVTRVGNTYVMSYTGDGYEMGIATQPVTNPAQTGLNDPAAVFAFYDGFDGSSLDLTKWSIAVGSPSQAVEAGGQLSLNASSSSFGMLTSQQSFGMDYLVEARAQHPQQGTANMVAEIGLIDNANFGNLVRIVDDFPSALGSTTWNREAQLLGQVDANWTAMQQPADQLWHTFRVYRQSPNLAGFQIDDNPVETVTSDVPVSSLPFFLMSYTEGAANQVKVDWVRARKIANPQPAAALIAPPVALNDAYSTPPNTVLIQSAAGVLANDSDPQGQVLTAQLVLGPAHGTLTLNADGSFSYTPAANYAGSDSFSYKAYDGISFSNAATVSLTVNNPAPATTSISPASSAVGASAFTLTVNGTGFISGSTVNWNGSSRTTTFVSSTKLTAAITAADLASAGSFPVTVFTAAPGGGTSNAQSFAVTNPAPATTSISPATGTAGGAGFTLTVNGTGFVAGSVVNWNGTSRTTTFVSSTRLTAAITAADLAVAGTASVTVFNAAPGGGTSNAQTFTFNNPAPTTTSISPTSANAGSAAFTLTVNGTGFVTGSVVNWNGASRTTTYVSSTQLTAAITAADVASAGTASVTVFNATPGGGTSTARTFTINVVNNPVPTTTSISPTSANAGSAAFTLTVNGTGFYSGSSVRWNGASRTTTFVSSTQLSAAITAADVATAGTASVTVFNATPGGGTSSARTFTINAVNNPVPTTSSISPASATAGSAAFTLTVNGTGFIAGSTVRWNGSSRTTTFVSSTQLTAAITAADVAAAGTAPVTVFNATPGGGTSNAQTFTVTAAAGPSFVQVTSYDPQGFVSSVSATYPGTQTAGNLNYVAIGWSDSTSTVKSVTDNKGNTYTLAVGPTRIGSGLNGISQSIYYATAKGGAGTIVTVTFNSSVPWPDLRIAEYAGVSTLDKAVGATGSTTTCNSGSVTTTAAKELLVAANYVTQTTTASGTGFTQRVMTQDQQIVEDRVVSAIGSYNATATVNAGSWVMQMVTFK